MERSQGLVQIFTMNPDCFDNVIEKEIIKRCNHQLMEVIEHVTE